MSMSIYSNLIVGVEILQVEPGFKHDRLKIFKVHKAFEGFMNMFEAEGLNHLVLGVSVAEADKNCRLQGVDGATIAEVLARVQEDLAAIGIDSGVKVYLALEID